jgi:hypothetical protein
MKITGENIIPASPAEVWAALNDPEVLRQSIPGCESFERVGENGFRATVAAKVGPIAARFNGDVTLSDINPPVGYTISGQGSGGAVGAAKGAAKVRLEPHAQGTRLTYDVDAQVTGKLAQIGSRLIESTAKMMAGQFFDRFAQIVGGDKLEDAEEKASGIPLWVWIGAAIAFGGGMLYLLLGS